MRIEDFEKELQAIDKDLSIRPNKPNTVFPELEKLAAICYKGVSLFTVPNFEIFDETNGNYGVDVRGDGRFIAHRNRLDAIIGVKAKLEQLTDPDYADAFFGRGVYSDAALESNASEPVVELVEEIKGDLTEVGGSTNINHPIIQDAEFKEIN